MEALNPIYFFQGHLFARGYVCHPTLRKLLLATTLAPIFMEKSGQLLEHGLALFATSDPPHLGPEKRPGTLAAEEIENQLRTATEPEIMDAFKLTFALVLLWHDHLNQAHTIAQDIPSSDGSYLHGIMHRREPDYENAKYWFRRVGTHPIFDELGTQVSSVAQAHPSRVIRSGEWDPIAFVDLCAALATKKDSAREQAARHLQAMEFHFLLRHFCGGKRS